MISLHDYITVGAFVFGAVFVWGVLNEIQDRRKAIYANWEIWDAIFQSCRIVLTALLAGALWPATVVVIFIVLLIRALAPPRDRI